MGRSKDRNPSHPWPNHNPHNDSLTCNPAARPKRNLSFRHPDHVGCTEGAGQSGGLLVGDICTGLSPTDNNLRITVNNAKAITPLHRKTMLSLGMTALLGLAICSINLVYWVFVATTSPLRSIPGPFWARFTRLWFLQSLARGDFHQTNIELHRKYGANGLISSIFPCMYRS